jgi:MarR family 2-MHQ and catechol resistance regulon transcriptional repressor
MNERAAPVEPLTLELVGAMHSVATRLEDALDPLGLSLAKFGALSKLVAAGEPLPLSALAERLACVRSNITQLVDRLEADQLVVRVQDPSDRRSVRAELTAQGRALHTEGLRALEAAERDLLDRLSAPQQDDLLRLLRLLRERA